MSLKKIFTYISFMELFQFCDYSTTKIWAVERYRYATARIHQYESSGYVSEDDINNMINVRDVEGILTSKGRYFELMDISNDIDQGYNMDVFNRFVILVNPIDELNWSSFEMDKDWNKIGDKSNIIDLMKNISIFREFHKGGNSAPYDFPIIVKSLNEEEMDPNYNLMLVIGDYRFHVNRHTNGLTLNNSGFLWREIDEKGNHYDNGYPSGKIDSKKNIDMIF